MIFNAFDSFDIHLTSLIIWHLNRGQNRHTVLALLPGWCEAMQRSLRISGAHKGQEAACAKWSHYVAFNWTPLQTNWQTSISEIPHRCSHCTDRNLVQALQAMIHQRKLFWWPTTLTALPHEWFLTFQGCCSRRIVELVAHVASLCAHWNTKNSQFQKRRQASDRAM